MRKRGSFRFAHALGAALLVLAVALPLPAQDGSAHPRITNGPVLEAVTPSSGTIAWSTNVSSGSVVSYGTAKHQLTLRSEMPWGGYTHRVTLHALEPDTTYFFQAKSPDAKGQIARVDDWLQGKKYISEIAKVWPKGPVLPIKIVPPKTLRPGEKAEFRTVISNNKAGHSFPTGPLDLIRAWVEVKVSDASGKVLFASGGLTPEGYVQPGAFELKAEGVNAAGTEIVRHDLWHYVGAKWKRAIFPGYSDMYEYHFNVPRNAKGPLTIAARLRYRKANQYFMDFAFPGKHLQTPITDLSSDRVEVPLASRRETRAKSPAKQRRVSSLTPAREPGFGE